MKTIGEAEWELEQLEYDLSVKRRALEYMKDNEDEEIDYDELCRSIVEDDGYNYQKAEENSMRNAWQQDLIDLYRYER